MPDPYLEAMLKGGVQFGRNLTSSAPTAPHRNKDRFEIAADSWIESQLNTIDFELECAGNALVSPAMKRAQKKTELREVLKKETKEELLTKAAVIAHTEARGILGTERYDLVENAFELMSEKLEELDLDGDLSQNLQTLLGIDNATIKALDEIAIYLFTASRFNDCMAVCTLLFTLVPEELHYRFRAGMAAQNDGNRTFALEAYAAALKIDPSFIGAALFSAECYLAAGDKTNARELLEQARAIAEEQAIELTWRDLLGKLQNWLALS